MYKVKATYLPRTDMHFDRDYYFRVHVPLARRQAEGKLNIARIEVETEATPLTGSYAPLTPCVFSIYFESEGDLDAFREFFSGSDVEPMRTDVANYTNCELQWTVCRVQEV